MPDGYGGLTWTNVRWLTEPNGPVGSGLGNSVVSAPNVAFNVCCLTASISSLTPFNLISGFFTGAWNDGLQVTVTGLNGNTTVCTVTFSASTTGPTFELLNVNGVTSVTFSGSGGTHNPALVPTGTNFGMDNLTVAE